MRSWRSESASNLHDRSFPGCPWCHHNISLEQKTLDNHAPLWHALCTVAHAHRMTSLIHTLTSSSFRSPLYLSKSKALVMPLPANRHPFKTSVHPLAQTGALTKMAVSSRFLLLFRYDRRRWLAYAVAVVSPSTVFWLVWLLQGGAHLVPLYPFFSLAVLVSAVLGGLVPGLIAVGLSVLYIYRALAPHYVPVVGQRPAWISFVAFAILGVSVSLIIAILRRKQEALERSEAQLRTIVNNITERLYVCDGSGRPLIVNEAFSAFFTVKEPTYPQSFSEGVEVFDLSGRPLPLQAGLFLVSCVVSRCVELSYVFGLKATRKTNLFKDSTHPRCVMLKAI